MQYYERRGFMANVPPVTRTLIFVNLLFFAAYLLNKEFMVNAFALFYPASRYFHIWQIVTHMFMHGGFWHIFFNMYALYIFGSVVEQTIGSRKFALFYFICGLGAVALHLGTQYIEASTFISQMSDTSLSPEKIQAASRAYSVILHTPTVGASGAIYGLLMGYALLYPNNTLTLIFPPVTLSARTWVIVFAAIELFTGISGWVDGVAHFAHLGGMLIGWAMISIWRRKGTLFNGYQRW
ncbi:MAG: rhomboid family intramembrane serine protease [Bacteroidales bacterium]|nr:rhomboid family intramembrane serine protease [Bacteroidales bacterium]